MKRRAISTLMISMVFSAGVYAQESASQKAKVEMMNLVSQGNPYRDAFDKLAYEIAYEAAAVQAKQPCRKMVRGL